MIVNGKTMTTQDAMDRIHQWQIDMWDKLKRDEMEPKKKEQNVVDVYEKMNLIYKIV